MFAHAACGHDWPGDHHWFTISVWWQSQILAATIGRMYLAICGQRLDTQGQIRSRPVLHSLKRMRLRMRLLFDVETKRQILPNLDKYGVKNCSWVHQLSKSTKTHNAHTEDVIRNFYTRPLRCMFFCCHVAALHVACTLSGSRRSAIFKIEGVDESSLANDDMKQQLLEEILTMCELRFGHARQTQLHDKFDVLSKYYFVHSQGQKQTTGTVEEQTLDSSCTGMKGMQVKNKAAMDIMMGKTSSANRPDPESLYCLDQED